MLTEKTPLSKRECEQLNPVVLAFVGDAVYATYVRERLVLSCSGKLIQLQRAEVEMISARGQSEFLETLLPLLTEEETAIFRRGKNAKKSTKSKSATSLEYSRSTGLEAVLGYLYLTGNDKRIRELLSNLGEEKFHCEEVPNPFKPNIF